MKVTCVCAVADIDRLAELMFCETTTIGVRYTVAHRKTLRRNSCRFKRSSAQSHKDLLYGGRPVNFVPEFEDCRRLAMEKGVALKEVQSAAVHAYLKARS